MIRIWQVVILLLFLSMNDDSQANARTSIIDIKVALKKAYESGNLQEAYAIATQHAFDLEGHPDFDFYYGLTSLGLMKYPEAQFAFERLVSTYPNQGRYRLEYARTLFHLRHYDLATDQLETVLAMNPPDTVQKNIHAFLDAITVKRRQKDPRWFGFVDMGSGFDSNINGATDLESIGNIVLSDTSRSTDSSYLSARSSFNYEKPFNQRNGVSFSIDSQHKHNAELSDYNYDTLQLRSSYSVNDDVNRYRYGISYVKVLLDGQGYQSAMGLTTRWSKQWSAKLLSQVGVGYTTKTYDQVSELDSTQPSFNLTLITPFQGFNHALSLVFTQDQAKQSGNDDKMRTFSSIGYQLSKSFSANASVFSGLSYSQAAYQDEHPIFAKTRRDTSTNFLLGGKWNFDKTLTATLEGSLVDNASNLEIYDHDRHRIEVNVRWQFQ